MRSRMANAWPQRPGAHRGGQWLDAVPGFHGNGALRARTRLLRDAPRRCSVPPAISSRRRNCRRSSLPASRTASPDLLAKSEGGDVVEFGAGSGVLAAELMAALQRLGAQVAPLPHRRAEPGARARASASGSAVIRGSLACATGSSGSKRRRPGMAGRRVCERGRRRAAGRPVPRDRGRLRSDRRG